MNIPIKIDRSPLNKYVELLFQHLQRDKQFEGLIIKARRNLSIELPILESGDNLNITIKPILRSETANILSAPSNIYVELPVSFKLDEEVDQILDEYKFLQDWRSGLRTFITDNIFTVSDRGSLIKLKVRNKRMPLNYDLKDNPVEEAIKITLTSKVSKNELMNWIDKNWKAINFHLDNLPNLSKKNFKRLNYERDRLIVYLRVIKKMTWADIAQELEKTGDYGIADDTLQQAYKDFPFK